MNQDIKTLKITQLKKAKYNPRKISKKELDKLVKGIKKYGLVQPVVVNKDYTIIGGHQRVEACRQLGWKEVSVVVLDLSIDDEKELNLALNKIGGDWDETALFEILGDLAEKNMLELTGFNHKDVERLQFKEGNTINRKLIDDYIIPPFSIFDAKQGYWQKRKKEWHEQLGYLKEGREGILGMDDMEEKHGGTGFAGVSQYDPVLLEVLYTWYAEPGDIILDPFAGSAIAGLIASRLGYKFIGTDTWKKQVETNIENAKRMGEKGCEWHNDSGANIGKYLKKGEKARLIVTDPPYFNLEVYQKDNKNDISTATSYAQFLEMYEKILAPTYDILREDGWIIIKIGNVRDEEGNYYNLVGDTISMMQKIGYKFYNEIILATPLATAGLRARKIFDAKKKVVKAHQNILFFSKGKEVAINKTLRGLLENGQTATAHHDVLVFKK